MSELALAYRQAEPFPHLVIDDFLPEQIAAGIERAARQAPAPVDSSNGFTQRRKLTLNDWALMPPLLREACAFFQSGTFVTFLEAISGVAGLIPDPHLEGGGLHRVATGGFLKLHTDFNWNQRLGLHRRLNVLYYLNSDYQPEWAGDLLLSSRPRAQTMNEMRAIAPRFNRLVLFNTNDTTFHGHPLPHSFPEHYPRTSLAFYYYSSTPPPLAERRRLRCGTTRYVPARRERLDLHGVPLRSRLGYLLRRWTPLG